MESLQVDVLHENLEMNMPELRFQREKTISEVKENLYRRTGTETKSMQLWLVDSYGNKRELLDQDERSIGSVFPPESEGCGWRLNIVDTDSASVSFTPFDETDVPKYEAKSGRPGFQQFRKDKRRGSSGDPPTASTGMEMASSFDEGQRVLLIKSEVKGTVKYVGKCANAAPGFFVGVELDTASGKHDGEVKGKRLFTCKPDHGILVRPDLIKAISYAEDVDERNEL